MQISFSDSNIMQVEATLKRIIYLQIKHIRNPWVKEEIMKEVRKQIKLNN
jgi:hypothetical protein